MLVRLTDLIGFIGAAQIAFVYFLNQAGRLDSGHWIFPASNLVGSLMILVSLWGSFNFPSLLIEIFWSAISIFGLVRVLGGRFCGQHKGLH